MYSICTQGTRTLVYIDQSSNIKEGDVVYTPAPFISTAFLTGDKALYPHLSVDDLTQSSQLLIVCSILLIGYISASPLGTLQTFEIKILDVTCC